MVLKSRGTPVDVGLRHRSRLEGNLKSGIKVQRKICGEGLSEVGILVGREDALLNILYRRRGPSSIESVSLCVRLKLYKTLD